MTHNRIRKDTKVRNNSKMRRRSDMKTKIGFILFLILFINYFLCADTIIPEGNVSGVWNLSGSPYLIEGDITIPDSELLLIDPGVLVEFQGYYALNVQGRLLAIGNEQDSIRFTINDTTGFYSDSDSKDCSWKGLNFDNISAQNDSSIISYSIIEHATSSTHGGGIYVNNFSKLKISNSLIQYNICNSWNGVSNSNGAGIYLKDSDANISNNIIRYNEIEGPNNGGGIAIYNSSPYIANNIFHHNNAYYGGGVYSNKCSAKLVNNLFYNNDGNGSGLYSDGDWTNQDSIYVINNTFTQNNGECLRFFKISIFFLNSMTL